MMSDTTRSDGEDVGAWRRSTARRDLMVSLGVFGLIVVAALAGLAHEENWRKFARVAIAFVVYVTTLLTLLRVSGRARDGGGEASGRLPFRAFALAAAAAELSSGWLRPNTSAGVTLAVAPAAAFLLGGVHWLALRAWRSLREQVVRGRVTAATGGRATTNRTPAP